MPVRPRPPFPPIDPIDTCTKLLNQSAYISDAFSYMSALLHQRYGSAFIYMRSKFLDSELTGTLAAFASNWNGVIPPFVPLICRPLYSSVMSRRREAYRMLAIQRKKADKFVGGKFVVDGSTINRPHDRKEVLKQMLRAQGF